VVTLQSYAEPHTVPYGQVLLPMPSAISGPCCPTDTPAKEGQARLDHEDGVQQSGQAGLLDSLGSVYLVLLGPQPRV